MILPMRGRHLDRPHSSSGRFPSTSLPPDCVTSPFMVRQACPEQPFILREPQDERLVEGLTTSGLHQIRNQLLSHSP